MNPTTTLRYSPKLERLTPEALAGNPRARIGPWLRYRDVVIAALRQHPKPYIFSPKSSPLSVVSKLRDAVRGAIAFQHPIDDDYTHEDLLRWYSEIVFKTDGTSVYVGPPQKAAEALAIAEVPSNATELTFDTLSFEQVSAFTLLLSTSCIRGPIKVIHPPDISILPQRPNVNLLHREDGSLVML